MLVVRGEEAIDARGAEQDRREQSIRDRDANSQRISDELNNVHAEAMIQLEPHIEDFAVNPLLARMETAFAAAAREKGLFLRVVPTRLLVRSDPVTAERAVEDLSELFRAALGAGQGESTLAEEIHLAER